MIDKLYQIILNWLISDRVYDTIPLCDFNRICYEVRPCDVLLIEGRSRVSEIIKLVTQSSWSHAALYIGEFQNIKKSAIYAKSKGLDVHAGHGLNYKNISEIAVASGVILGSTAIKEYNENFIKAKSLLDIFKS